MQRAAVVLCGVAVTASTLGFQTSARATETARADRGIATKLAPTAVQAGYPSRHGGLTDLSAKLQRAGVIDGWDGSYGSNLGPNAEFAVYRYRSAVGAKNQFQFGIPSCPNCTPTSIGITGARARARQESSKSSAGDLQVCYVLVSQRRAVWLFTMTCGAHSVAKARSDGLRLHRIVHHNAFRLGL